MGSSGESNLDTMIPTSEMLKRLSLVVSSGWNCATTVVLRWKSKSSANESETKSAPTHMPRFGLTQLGGKRFDNGGLSASVRSAENDFHGSAVFFSSATIGSCASGYFVDISCDKNSNAGISSSRILSRNSASVKQYTSIGIKFRFAHIRM